VEGLSCTVFGENRAAVVAAASPGSEAGVNAAKPAAIQDQAFDFVPDRHGG